MLHMLLLKTSKRLMAAGLAASCLAACQTTQQSDVFVVIDGNADGQLTLEEVETYGFKRMFNRFDKNKDNVITEDDLGTPDPNLMRLRDLDGDGQITYAEYSTAGHRQGTVKKLFDAADTDGNGVISKGEEEAYMSISGGVLLRD